MNDALTDLVRDMNKFRGQVDEKILNEDIVNILQIHFTTRRRYVDICCSLEKHETSLANQMRK